MLVIAFTLVPSTVMTAPMSVSFDFWSITTPLICCAHIGELAAESNPNTIIPLLAFITYIVWLRLQRYGGYITPGLQWGWKALTKLRQWCYGRKSVAFFGDLNLEKLALICWFCVKCIFLLCKMVIIVIFVWLLADFILPLHLNTYFI